MTTLLASSLTGDQAIAAAVPALVVRVENIYESGGAFFSVDASAAWSADPFELTVRDAPDRRPRYAVAGYVAHINDAAVGAKQRMRSGHYVAYVHCGGDWFQLDDSRIVALDTPPTRFPYLVFLVRTDGRRMLRGKQTVGTPDSAMHELLQKRAAECLAPIAHDSQPARKRLRAQTGRDRTGRDQTGRDQTGRDQTNQAPDTRDRSGRLDERAKRAWTSKNTSDNRDHSRSDAFNNLDNPFQRYVDNWELRRTNPDVDVRQWTDRAEPCLPQPCGLCPDTAFLKREDLVAHIDAEHGGLQRYRNARFSMLSLLPYVVKGQEWRAVQANFAEFYARSAMDWEWFTPEMDERLSSPEGLPADRRWSPRCLRACVFCARRLWQEELYEVYLAGEYCFMHNPGAVAEMLDWSRYHQVWEDIPEAELKGSAVSLRIGCSDEERLVLLHKRRVNDQQRWGDAPVFVCEDCHAAFSLKKPRMCRFALANHMWLGRWMPLFRNANLSHQMLLALARIVTTKLVLRPEGNAKQTTGGGTGAWDFLFHQSGMIGSAILFGNGSCKEALDHFPPTAFQGEFAVSFVGKIDPGDAVSPPDAILAQDGLDAAAQAAQLAAQRAVKGIAKLKVDRGEMDAQAERLQATNVVYKTKHYQADVVARWCPDKAVPVVPPLIVDRVIAVEPDAADDDNRRDPAGRVLFSGPGDATAAGEAERADADVEAAKQAQFISAFSPDDIPGMSQSAACMEVAALENQLNEVENATKRSIAAEAESLIEGGAGLVDEAGQARILEICQKVRKSAEKLALPDRLYKIQDELRKASMGLKNWQMDDASKGLDPLQQDGAEAQPKVLAELACPTDRTPLSLWDWRIWTQARPTLWAYGDAGNLDPRREDAPLLTHEWITAMCIREEMEYDVSGYL